MATKKIVVLCDGTWCGKEANTRTNIDYLAQLIGVQNLPSAEQTLIRPGLVARYADGVGLGATFLEYLFNGATAQDIAKECIDAYHYIVSQYKLGDEIWMFGLSRGAFTVRCVAGMINNCGIVTRRDNVEDTKALCEEVYRTYRSRDSRDEPNSPQMVNFRKKASHQVPTPVKFMGLLDTVGSLGIPHFSGGIGFEYPEFHNQTVSSVVEKVYHALSLHDRLCVFQPCFAYRDEKHDRNPNLQITEKWFPGAHYDLGRQRFKFFRGQGLLSVIPNWLSGTVEPNHVLADLVLDWMLAMIALQDPRGVVVPNVANKRRIIQDRINAAQQRGTGDVYDNILSYFPLGSVLGGITGLLGGLPGVPLQVAAIIRILAVARDRRIPDDDAVIYHYKTLTDDVFAPATSISALAQLPLPRYKSRTYETFQLYLLAGGVIDSATYNARV